MSTVIRVENISKQYRLGIIGTGTITHDLKRLWYQARGKEDPYLKIGEKNNRRSKSDSGYVWALNDVSFDVKEGEVLGIIGRNGAGKSTLLKILSRTTSPTTGSIKIRGHIASLLEVGTGFHPDLTGRENIFLNGAILGMSKKEIARKLDEIIDFSGVEKYVDTPVKRYSSGMYVRLAFAVAAHLDPEILIVDEVLAVGDAEFQKKCLGKMKDVSGQGRTVLFVSHNMVAVKSLCNRAIFLADGTMQGEGNTSEIINQYLLGGATYFTNRVDLTKIDQRQGSGAIKFSQMIFLNENYEVIPSPVTGSKLIIRLFFELIGADVFKNCRVSMALHNAEGLQIVLSSEMVLNDAIDLGKSDYVDFEIPHLPLTKGEYFIILFLESNSTIQDWLVDSVKFYVEDGNFYSTSKPYPPGHDGKIILVDFNVRKNVQPEKTLS